MAFAAMATIVPGSYISWWKALIIVVILLPWARALTFIDKDADVAHLPRIGLNAGMLSGLILGYLAFFLMPNFWLGLLSLLFFLAVDIGVYLQMRQKSVGLADLKKELHAYFQNATGVGKQKAQEAIAGQIMLLNKANTPQPVPEGEAPERPAYDAAQTLLTKPLRYGAQRLDVSAGDPVNITYIVDGVQYDGDAMDRSSAMSAIAYVKGVAGLDQNERRKPQTGVMRSVLDNNKREMQVTTYGSATGESMRIYIDPKKRFDFKLDVMGFTENQLDVVRQSISQMNGVVLLSAPKSQGLKTLMYGVVRGHDAFLHHIHTIERNAELDLEGITQNALPAAATPAEEAKQVGWVLSQEPDVLLMTSVTSPAAAAELSGWATESHRVYVGLRASSTFDALRQWRKLVGDDTLAMKNLQLIINGRLVRKLCSACKIGYSPDPVTLRKLNMNPDEVGKLYMARKEPIRDAKGNRVPCPYCFDLGYKGRVGVYESMVIDAEMRQIISTGGSDAQLKQAFRKQRGKLLQEQALAQVKAGETSVEEVLRVLKENPPATPSSSATAKAR